VLTKDLLRVSRVGGGYYPQFVDSTDLSLAARVVDTYETHVGERRGTLEDALSALEADAEAFKLVRGFAALCDRETTFETSVSVPPERVRRVVFEAAESSGGATTEERDAALATAADRLGVDVEDVECSLYADRDVNQLLVAFEPRWTPEELLDQYNLSLAQTALFDATEVRIRSADPKALVSAVKRLRLMYEVHQTPEGRELVVTGPDSLFRRTRRYGTGFARLLRTVAKTADWQLTATIDDRGTDRELTLTDADVSVPGVDPVAEPTFDSGVEADFAARFRSLDLDWTLVREPEPLAVDEGTRVMIPDFAFDYDPPGATTGDGFRVYFEIMGFWTPDYVEKKLGQLRGVEDVDLLVAVDESLAVSDAVEAHDHRAIPYTGSVRVKDVVDVLREYETELVADAADSLPDSVDPAADVVTLADLAAEYGVSVDALDGKSFPAHRRVGRTLVRPSILDDLADAIDPGMSLAEAEALFDEYGLGDASAVLSALGYRVAWEGLSGGTVREK
jgi:predicted nuclease of restriction endonuclease-like RecB superfamily